MGGGGDPARGVVVVPRAGLSVVVLCVLGGGPIGWGAGGPPLGPRGGRGADSTRNALSSAEMAPSPSAGGSGGGSFDDTWRGEFQQSGGPALEL